MSLPVEGVIALIGLIAALPTCLLSAWQLWVSYTSRKTRLTGTCGMYMHPFVGYYSHIPRGSYFVGDTVPLCTHWKFHYVSVANLDLDKDPEVAMRTSDYNERSRSPRFGYDEVNCQISTVNTLLDNTNDENRDRGPEEESWYLMIGE